MLKPIITFLFMALLNVQFSAAQITINSADMPSSGDIVRFSTAANNTMVDLTQTGPNQTWDFSSLQPVGQSLDTFLSVSATSIFYLFTFGGNSNVAARGIQISSIGVLPVSNGFSFYNRSASGYRQKGFGVELNGLPVPVSYTNDDDIYLFPLNYGDQDTSDSDYSITLPGQGSANGNQRRINHVDGWGTVITPYGTFPALRMVSTLTGEDSIYVDTLGIGFNTPRPLTREYKWLATGQDIPVLQINTTANLAGVETVSLIKYRDSLRVFASVFENNAPGVQLRIYPNPVTSKDEINIGWPYQTAFGLKVDFFSVDGRLVAGTNLDAASGWTVKLPELQITQGVYLVKVSDGLNESTTRLVVTGE